MSTETHVHNFAADLAWSNSDAQDAAWLRAYRERWGSIDHIEQVREREKQRRGIDREVYFAPGAWVTVEEKTVRGYPPCLPLEVISAGRPSWSHPDGVPQAAWLAIRRTTTGKTYLYSTAAWRRALERHLADWMRRYAVRQVTSSRDSVHGQTETRTWTVTVVCVPESVIERAVRDAEGPLEDPDFVPLFATLEAAISNLNLN